MTKLEIIKFMTNYKLTCVQSKLKDIKIGESNKVTFQSRAIEFKDK